MIRPITNHDWQRLEPLWLSLFEHQRAHGMLVELPPNAYELWVAAFTPLLERFAFVLVAEEENSLVGFLSGRIRAQLPHFGGRSVGYLSELFVIDSFRRRGIADGLLSAGIAWFRERDIHRFELPVVVNNSQARQFYLRRGWVEEFTQLVLQDEPKAN
jgi:GNAT superfamily N-acetyltransferase